MRIFFIYVLFAAAMLTKAHAGNGVQIFNADATGFYVRCTFKNYNFESIGIKGQNYFKTIGDNTTPLLSKGNPDIPRIVIPVALPSMQDISVQVVSSSNISILGMDLSPSKGSIKRTTNPANLEYVFSDMYKRNTDYPLNIVALQSVYSIADQAGQNIEVYPVQYNPVLHAVTIHEEIVLHVLYSKPWGNNNYRLHINQAFEAINNNRFFNYLSISPYISKYPVTEEGDMLIISPDSFKTTLIPFVQWKQKRGIHVHLKTIDSIGYSSIALRKYIKHFYDTHNLAYVVLAGDAAQVPSNVARLSDGSNGNSDNLYGCVSGSDFYPDIIVGRFSSENTTQLQTQLYRSIYYERDINSSNNWLSNGLSIGSNLGPGDNSEYDWQHERLIRKELLHYTYNHDQELYDGTHANDGLDTLYSDQNGNPNTSNFLKVVNNGVGIINYTGHGDYNSISTSNVSSTDIFSLTNANKLPFCWIVGCQVGNFVTNTCFAETGMRSTYKSQPSGWLAILGSTVDQWWDEPMRAQDEFDTLLCQLKTYSRFTYGAISLSGELAMNDKYTYTGYDMTQTWVCFGDPSLLVRTANPINMSVKHDTLRTMGTDSLTVWCNVNGAHVVLTQHDSIIGVGIISSGKTWIKFDPLVSTDSVYVTITHLNCVTYTGVVKIVKPSGPYIAVVAHNLNDTTGNRNHRADFNEHILVNMALKNIGIKTGTDIHLKVNSPDRYIQNINILKSNVGVLYPNDVLFLNNAFSFDVADSVPDGYNTTFIVTITDSLGNTYTSDFHETLLAPVLHIVATDIEDTTGSNKWWLSPGQSGYIQVHITNTGHSMANARAYNVICNNSYVYLFPSITATLVAPDDTVIIKIPISVSTTVSSNSRISFNINVADSEYTANTLWQYVLGRTVERFETGSFNLFNWMLSGDSSWFITNSEKYEGKYSARSGYIGNSQASNLSIKINCTQKDTLFFAYKVSSEHKWDSLMFLLDSTLMLHWSGEQGWSIASLPIDTGTHLLQWTYAKDPFNTVGQDCGWIDDIIFPAFSMVTSGDAFVGNKKLNISIMPNPATSLISFIVKDNTTYPIHLNIWNTSGQLISSALSYNNNCNMDVSAVSSGTYIIQVFTSVASHFEKVIVAH